MASDQQVSAKHVLQSLMRLKRQGSQRAMAELEQVEPDLAGYLMEELSLVHQKLLELGAPAGRTRWLQRRVESLALICIAALRQSHFDLWREEMAAADGPLARLDGSAGEGEQRADPVQGPAPPPPPGEPTRQP